MPSKNITSGSQRPTKSITKWSRKRQPTQALQKAPVNKPVTHLPTPYERPKKTEAGDEFTDNNRETAVDEDTDVVEKTV